MKKAMAIAVLAAFIVSLSGCANTDHPQAIQDSSGIEMEASEADVSTVPEENSAASVSESKVSSADSTVAVKTETESAQAEASKPITEPSIAAQMPTPVAESQPPQAVVSNDTPKSEPPKTVEPAPEPKPAPTQQPTPSPAEEAPKVEQPQETSPTEEPAVPDFNIQTWIDYAKTYAVSVGLRLESSAVDCWDNPITAGAYSTCLDRDIENRLNRYSRDEDITDVWIWAEARSDGSYDLYIGYA